MNNDFWTRTTNFKLFGKYPIFTKEEICSEIQYEGQIYNITVSKDYFDSEVKMNEKKKE